MTTTTPYGTLTDYVTGEQVRPARAGEWRHSAEAVNGLTAGGYTGAFKADGRTVFVDGGPRAEVDEDDIAGLRDEAGQAGDTDQATLCDQALDLGDDNTEAARAECTRVILDCRMQGE